MTRPVPPMAVEFVSRFEGYRNNAYPDPATGGEPWTIGFGHTGDVKEGDSCTKAQALDWLASDLQIAVQKLYGVIKADIIETCLNDGQWSALLSFAYNLGAKKTWDIWGLINAKRFDQAANEFSRFIKANGVPFQGLINRRNAEFALWHSMDSAPVAETPTSAETREIGVTPPTSAVKKPIWMSKTFWTGGGISAAGLVQSNAQTIQALAAPQAYHSNMLAKLVGLTAMLIVGAGVAIMAFKAIEQWNRTHR